MKGQILRPGKNKIAASGRMYYQNEDHAWNLLRIKKEILGEFKELEERMSKFSYNMLFCSEWNSLEKSIRKAKRDGLPAPLLVWFVKERA
jgi:hypothetical protein